NFERYNNLYQPGIEQPYGSAAWLAAAHRVDNGFSTTSTASGTENGTYPDRWNYQAAASYITGSQSIKFGFQDSQGHFNNTARANGDLYQNYVSGVPATVTVYATPARWEDSLNYNLGIFGQDIWTLKRLTLTIGGRWERVSEQIDGQPAQSGRFANIPAYPTQQMPIWTSFSPRTGVVYDLMGNGKTALRFGFNRYEAAATTTLASLYDPGNGSGITQTLTWVDVNHDDIAQGSPGCVFLTPGCEINFAALPANFGKISLAQPDPGLTRPYVLQYNTGVTHEVVNGVSVSFDWFHTVGKNFMERNNILRPGTYNADGTVTNASYRPFTVFSPVDGTPLTFYDVTSQAVAQAVQQIDTNDTNLTSTYNAYEFNFNARLPGGARLFGGTATDRTIANTCSAAANNPNFLITIGGVNYCDQTKSGVPWRTQFKLALTYPLPWYGVIVSGSYQGLPGYLLGTGTGPQPLTSGGAGAPNFTTLSGAAGVLTVTSTTKYLACPGNSASQGCVVGALMAPGLIAPANVPIDPPSTLLTPRINQVDFSIAKRIVIGRLKVDPKLDIFNALNSSDYFSVRATTYTPIAAGATATGFNGSGGSYLLPGSIIQGRLLRIAAVVNW
ncbi:MAG TPA: TonB-dependent receptor, partial [Vicinamibacterales bacterium]|nr:TonB-dependent receptor [Vicinamibacterales bacterium]